jgi:hypothetical protein
MAVGDTAFGQIVGGDLDGHFVTDRDADERILPETCASTLWPFSSFTRYMVAGSTSTTVPSNEIKLSFCFAIQSPAQEIIYALNVLWQFRFYHQLATDDGMPAVNDELDIDSLTDIERQNLKNVLSKIAAFQTKLSYDFLGTAAGR